jgi:hypothetical protein
MLDLMQVAVYASICKPVVYHTNACTVREVERTLMYQQFVLSKRLTSFKADLSNPLEHLLLYFLFP